MATELLVSPTTLRMEVKKDLGLRSRTMTNIQGLERGRTILNFLKKASPKKNCFRFLTGVDMAANRIDYRYIAANKDFAGSSTATRERSPPRSCSWEWLTLDGASASSTPIRTAVSQAWS